MGGKPKPKSDLPLVPESVLKKRHDLDDLIRKKAAKQQLQQSYKKRGKGGKDTFYVKKPETIITRAKSRRNNRIRFKRVQKKGMQTKASNKKQFATKELEEHDEDETMKDMGEEEPTHKINSTVTYQTNSIGAPVVFAVRIRDGIGAPKEVRRTLTQLRLRNIHEGVFLRYTDTTRKMLHLVEPWVVYGPPSKAVVSDLVERRGFGNINGERVPLSDNTIIEQELGDDCNIVCKEDLVHEITSAGDAFEKASGFLWPFRLTDHMTEFERRTLKLKDGKDYGDRGEAISEYIQDIL